MLCVLYMSHCLTVLTGGCDGGWTMQGDLSAGLISFDEGIAFHKLMGYIIVVCGFVHGACWIFMFTRHDVAWNRDATITGRLCLLPKCCVRIFLTMMNHPPGKRAQPC